MGWYGVAAVEPDPDAGPVRPGICAARLAAGQHARRSAGRRSGSGAGSRRSGAGPAGATTSRRSARRKTPARRRVGRSIISREVDDDPASAARRSGDRSEAWVARSGRPCGSILARRRPRARRPSGRGPRCEAVSSPPSNAEVREACDRGNRHHHRRRGGQGPGSGHPQSLRRARGRGRRDDRGDLDGVVPGPRGGRALQAGLRRARGHAGHPAPRGHAPAGQRREGDPRGPRRDRHLPDRRQPAPPVLDDRRHAPRRRDPGAVPARGGRRRHVRRRLGDVEPHDRVRGVGRDAQAPDGPDLGRPRRPARASSSTSTSSSGTGSAGCSASSPRTRRCWVSASTRTPPASSGPTASSRSSGAARSPSSTARSRRPTPGRSAATGR